jgi:hypothetical protein
MSEVVDGMEVTGSTASRVAEEEVVPDMFFLRSTPRLSV